MLYFVFLRFVSKREEQIQSKFDEKQFFSLTAHSAKSCSSCSANCIRTIEARMTSNLQI